MSKRRRKNGERQGLATWRRGLLMNPAITSDTSATSMEHALGHAATESHAPAVLCAPRAARRALLVVVVVARRRAERELVVGRAQLVELVGRAVAAALVRRHVGRRVL